MANFNKIILLGNLTRDPQLSYLPSKTPVCEISLAINHKFKGKDGQKRESVCFIECRCYGPQAEALNKYTSKGDPILIEGRLEFDQWESDGQKHSKHRVFITGFQFLGGREQGSPTRAATSAPQSQPVSTSYSPPDDDEIPF